GGGSASSALAGGGWNGAVSVAARISPRRSAGWPPVAGAQIAPGSRTASRYSLLPAVVSGTPAMPIKPAAASAILNLFVFMADSSTSGRRRFVGAAGSTLHRARVRRFRRRHVQARHLHRADRRGQCLDRERAVEARAPRERDLARRARRRE